jgi:outer membrane protein OmpA-like peptidoglycan-associated protein
MALLRILSVFVCTQLAYFQAFPQKGDSQIKLYAGRIDYFIDNSTYVQTQQSSHVDYVFANAGFGYGYQITNKLVFLGQFEYGNLVPKKVILSPQIGLLSSSIISSQLGFQFKLFETNKLGFHVNFGGNLQKINNKCDCFSNERYRMEYTGFTGLQLNYRMNKNWSLFFSGDVYKPISTTLNDPDYYMSNGYTDIKKDFLLKNSIGVIFSIERKKEKKTTIDSDKDGVADEVDKCANTPEGEAVDKEGCSESQLDSDNDGVNNKLDKCPNTPKGEKVNSEGCSESQLDSDSDGVTNNLDKCPNTTKGEKVNSEGCSESQLDADSDGVTNNLDKCPNTPKGEKVDSEGCSDSQIDSDADGVFNNKDKCPNEKGEVSNSGCPIISYQIEKRITQIANEINFVTNKVDLLVSSKTKLNELILILLENQELKIVISGHTDDVGSEESNFVLSQKRAEAVLEYLAGKSISRARMTALAFGEKQLKQNDLSEDSRAKNRRVEIKILK